MVAYINELIMTILQCKENRQAELVVKFGHAQFDPLQLIRALVEELDRLDPRDFEPSARHEFVVYRIMLRSSADRRVHTDNLNAPAAHARRMATLLDSYAGEGSRAKTRDFSFVTSPEVRRIVERDYRELALRTFPDGSWKSTVILAGSILEAVLYDVLTKDPSAISSSMSSPKAPKKRGNAVRDISQNTNDDQWSLSDLIKVACDLGRLPREDEQAIHRVLREYRNFVHPHLEARSNLSISEGHALASKGHLELILDHLAL